MNTLIVGAGNIGYYLARELSQEEDIFVLDSNPQKIETISAELDVLALRGDATGPEVLEKIGIDRMDAAIVVTDSDEVNLAVSMMAGKLGVPFIITRIRKDEWFSDALFSVEDIGVQVVIHPEVEMAKILADILSIPAATGIAHFSDESLDLVTFRVLPDVPIAGKKLSQVQSELGMDLFLISGILRGEDYFIPHGETVLQGGDECFLLTPRELAPLLSNVFHPSPVPLKRLVILGLGTNTIKIVQAFRDRDIRVVCIEKDRETAESLADKVPGVDIFCEEWSNALSLKKLSLGPEDCLVASTGNDHDNVFSALLAKKVGCGRVAAVVEDTDSLGLYRSLGVDIVLNTYLIAAGAILKAIRKGKVESIVRLGVGNAEFVEMVVTPKHKINGTPLKKMNLPQGILIACIIRGEDFLVPHGDTVIAEGDRLFLATAQAGNGKMKIDELVRKTFWKRN